MHLFFFQKKHQTFFWKCKISGVSLFLGVFFISFVSDKKTPLGVLYLICIKQTEMTLSEKVLQ